jgi:hypothetical protein
LTTQSDYSLSIVSSPLSTTTITHRDTGELTFQGEYSIWQSDDKDHSVGVYKKTTCDPTYNMDTTCQMLYNYRRNYFFNIGLRNLALTKSSVEPNLSLGSIFRFYEDANVSSWAGMHLNFNSQSFNDLKLILGVTNPNVNGVISFGMLKKNKSTVNTEVKEIHTLEKTGVQTNITKTNFVSYFTDSV